MSTFVEAYNKSNRDEIYNYLDNDCKATLMKMITEPDIDLWKSFTLVMEYLIENQPQATIEFLIIIFKFKGEVEQITKAVTPILDELWSIASDVNQKQLLLGMLFQDSEITKYLVTSGKLDELASMDTIVIGISLRYLDSFLILYYNDWCNFRSDYSKFETLVYFISKSSSDILQELYKDRYDLFTCDEINDFAYSLAEAHIPISYYLRDPRIDLSFLLRIVFERQTDLEAFRILLADPRIDLLQEYNGVLQFVFDCFPSRDFLKEVLNYPGIDWSWSDFILIRAAFNLEDKSVAEMIVESDWFMQQKFSSEVQTYFVTCCIPDINIDLLIKLLRIPTIRELDWLTIIKITLQSIYRIGDHKKDSHWQPDILEVLKIVICQVRLKPNVDCALAQSQENYLVNSDDLAEIITFFEDDMERVSFTNAPISKEDLKKKVREILQKINA